MSTHDSGRERAARRFNALDTGRIWSPEEMGLFEIHFHGWPEGAIPERAWLPLRDIDSRDAAALVIGVSPSSICGVIRVPPALEARLRDAGAIADWPARPRVVPPAPSSAAG